MLGRIAVALGELAAFNSLYLRSPDFRAHQMRSTASWRELGRPSAQSAAERRRAGRAAAVHAGLSPAALALTGLTLRDGSPRHVNLVLSELDPAHVFAGVHTALEAASGLATRLGLPLRVLTLTESAAPERSRRLAERMLENRFGAHVPVVPRQSIGAAEFHPDDAWVVTHWTTAHAAQVSDLDGGIRADRVVYLVQDFEPGFTAWSTAWTTARATYDAGFTLLVNSAPLAHYLARHTGVPVEDSLVFSPALDEERLRSVASKRTRGPVQVFFYGRPGKPRNLYALGIAALREAVLRLGEDAAGIEFVSAGEPHDPVDLGSGVGLVSLGALAWDDYFTALGRAGVVLSLQASPHPSHPPLEAASSGAIAVTNEFEGTRSGLHPRLHAVEATPAALGSAIAEAVRSARRDAPGPYEAIAPDRLGGSLDAALTTLAERLRPR